MKENISSDRWTSWRKINFEYFKKNLAKEPKGGKLVDLGSGINQFAILKEKFSCLNIDFSPFEEVDLVADLNKPLSLKNDFCDIVFMSNVLEHLPYPERTLKESFRILKRGGKIFGTVPFFLSPHQEPYDFFRYTYIALEKLLKETGFKEIEVEALGTPVDIFESISNFFFNLLITGKTTGGQKILARLLRKINKIFLTFFRNSPPPSTKNFALGYGFKAVK